MSFQLTAKSGEVPAGRVSAHRGFAYGLCLAFVVGGLATPGWSLNLGGGGLGVEVSVGSGGIGVGANVGGLDVDACVGTCSGGGSGGGGTGGGGTGGGGTGGGGTGGGGTGGGGSGGGGTGGGGTGGPGLADGDNNATGGQKKVKQGMRMACAKDGNATTFNGFVVRDRA